MNVAARLQFQYFADAQRPRRFRPGIGGQHGIGLPMKREIWRNYPVMDNVELVERLLDRGVVDQGRRVSRQPGRCCATGCQVPAPPGTANTTIAAE
jgi:4-hydroxybutyryl-CoA dehydratase / vinylacetyl-CoA-Delta-isomerase